MHFIFVSIVLRLTTKLLIPGTILIFISLRLGSIARELVQSFGDVETFGYIVFQFSSNLYQMMDSTKKYN